MSIFKMHIWKMQSLMVPICLEQFDKTGGRPCPEYIYIFSFFDKLTLKDNIKHGLDKRFLSWLLSSGNLCCLHGRC
ncbi:hypothetical protein NC653_030971 [Populus alba x Populus x berolinensis]|uniref:Uncharacterized protein n=1 Tax=Populus alba x Populus x berolinensis TaxID=444605 RepID=A0AAD6LXP3_9ROSI|nr:hypothetical protein NC653_030971 [Populus alba x Populus x berolinensis]